MITEKFQLNEWHEATGRLRYSPQRRNGKEAQKWWLVIDCPEEIGKFYRHLLYLNTYKTVKLHQPYWGSHITVIRNEEPPKPELWSKYNGERVVFQYGEYAGTNHTDQRWKSFYWLGAKCAQALDIREELGLKRDPYPDFHLTIGTIENEQNRRIL